MTSNDNPNNKENFYIRRKNGKTLAKAQSEPKNIKKIVGKKDLDDDLATLF